MARSRTMAKEATQSMFDPSEHPVMRIEWVLADELSANDYNPNMVQATEMRLLAHSILSTKWIQPILVNQDLVIIDGFHRATLAKTNKKVKALTGGRVPVVKLTLTEPERMMLTIRINRAKGTHMAFKMADIVKALVNDHDVSVEAVMEGIGAGRAEVELLMQDSVFKKLDVANHTYSKAWYPK